MAHFCTLCVLQWFKCISVLWILIHWDSDLCMSVWLWGCGVCCFGRCAALFMKLLQAMNKDLAQKGITNSSLYGVCLALMLKYTFVYSLQCGGLIFLWSEHKFTTIRHFQVHHAHCLFFSWCRMESPHCMWLPKGETQTWWSSCWIVEGRSMPKPGWVFLFPECNVAPSWEWIGIFACLILVFFRFFKPKTGNAKFHS